MIQKWLLDPDQQADGLVGWWFASIGWVRAYSGWILGAGCVISSNVECIYIYIDYLYMIFSDRVQSSTLIPEIISWNIVLVPIELSLVAEMEINLPDSGNPQDILKESAESVWHLIAFDPCRGKKRDAWNRTWSLYWCRAKALWGVEIWGQRWSRCQGYVKNSFLSVSKGVTSDSEKPNWSELIGVFYFKIIFCYHDVIMANFASMTLLRTRRLSAHYSVFRYALRCAVPLALPRLWRLRLFHCAGRDLSNRLWMGGVECIKKDRNITVIQKDQTPGVSETNFKADRLILAIY